MGLGLLGPGCSSWPAGASTGFEQLLGPRDAEPASSAGGGHPGKVLLPLAITQSQAVDVYLR